MFDGQIAAFVRRLRDAPAPLQPVLRLRGVSKAYMVGERAVLALADIDLTLHAGVMVAIVGPSGSGKSTLMNILGCLDRPSSGSYRIGRLEVRDCGRNALARLRRRYFGFVFQRCHLLPRLTALQNVEMPAIYAGAPPAERRARAAKLLIRLGLGDRMEHLPSELSGGQQQRVAIARAMINGAAVILADEPTGALDSATGQATLRNLTDLQARGHTVVIVTHDPEVAAHAERIIELRDGRIVADRPNPARANGRSDGGAARQRLQRLPGKRGPVAPARLLLEAFTIARQALLMHRMRTGLTIIGIAIGIAAVVSIMAVGEGGRRHMQETIGAMTSNLIEFRRGTGWGDSRASAVHTLLAVDAAALQGQDYVAALTPLTQGSFTVRHRDASATATVSGVGEGYFEVRNVAVRHGRTFRSDDLDRQAQVAVIDQETRRALFTSTEDPIGQVIIVGNVPCTVIGVASAASQQLLSSPGPNVLLPYTTAGVRLFGRMYFDSIVVRTAAGLDGTLVEHSLSRLLAYQHGTRDFFTNNMDALSKAYESTTRSITLMLSMIASIALLVGGVGVMNIMLVSVSERSREIGIRVAAGARRADISRQFLSEAVAICVIGGAAGIALALGAGLVFSVFVTEWRMVFAPASFVLAFGCAMLMGLVFGFLPARRAADLDPVAALARE